MAGISCTRGGKRKMSAGVKAAEPEARSSRVLFLSPSLLLFEIPPSINTSLPVWEAMRDEQAEIAWTVDPYSLSINVTPVTSKQRKRAAPSTRERSSSVVQTSPFSSILQLQIVIQPINQQPGASQNHSMLITFPQNAQSVSCPPSPSPAASLFVSLPIVVTQAQPAHQLSTPIKEHPTAPTQSPQKTCIKQAPQILSDAPLPFHTRSSSNVHICDDFVFGYCTTEQMCKMHHTPYPFHWQLWSVTTHKWVDISPSSQVLIERLYCDVNQDAVCLKNGNARYTLTFDSMELDDSSVYDGVRRLTNTYCQLENPRFASKMRFYWWHISWQEYSQSVSAALLKKISEKESEYSFNIGSQHYKVDLTTMIQTNMTTGFQRAVRCRPVYRSLDSMKPYLNTQVLPDSAEPDCYPPGANFSVDPLEEFSSWYPPVWCQAPGQDYSLVDVPAGTLAYQRIQELFYKTLPETKVDIVGIQQIQNLLYWDKYQRHKVHMQKQHSTCLEPLERHLFHGTTKEAAEDICTNNFDPRVAGVNGVSHGFGTYFASSASVSNMFSTKFGPSEVRHMFLAKVLVGKFTLGKSNYRRPPQIASKMKQRRLYDACVDNVKAPNIFVVYNGCQCYPYYLIKYKDLSREVDIQ